MRTIDRVAIAFGFMVSGWAAALLGYMLTINDPVGAVIATLLAVMTAAYGLYVIDDSTP